MMRKFVPVADRDPLDLGIIHPAPAYDTANRVGWVAYKIFPDTLEDLGSRLGIHAEAGIIDTLWSPVSRWLLKSYGTDQLSNPYDVASLAVRLCMFHDRKRLGFPVYPDNAIRFALDDLTEDNRQEALRVAAETIVDCQRAGMHEPTAGDIKHTYQLVTNMVIHLATLDITKETAACPL